MSLDKLVAQIEEDANREIDRIIGEAKAEVEKKIKEAEKEAEKEGSLLLQRAEREFENLRRSELSRVQHEVRMDVLKKKEEIINECFSKAMERFRKLSGKEYVGFVKPLVEKSIKEVGKNCVILPSREEDKRLAKELGLSVSDEMVKATGGVVVKSKDGRVTIDNTFEGMLKRMESEIRERVGGLLFMEM
ncbi:MAG: hypothetical protein J7L32_04555 [Thermoplasmata archaeon]|nr:hypothetical protein [Thermoplasmata archaeon]